jgi:hypothetical protein
MTSEEMVEAWLEQVPPAPLSGARGAAPQQRPLFRVAAPLLEAAQQHGDAKADWPFRPQPARCSLDEMRAPAPRRSIEMEASARCARFQALAATALEVASRIMDGGVTPTARSLAASLAEDLGAWDPAAGALPEAALFSLWCADTPSFERAVRAAKLAPVGSPLRVAVRAACRQVPALRTIADGLPAEAGAAPAAAAGRPQAC